MLLRIIWAMVLVILTTTARAEKPFKVSASIGPDDLAKAKETAKEILEVIKPTKGRNPPTTDRRSYTLWGDLFGDGKILALVPLNPPLGITVCEAWQKGRWVFQQAWKIGGGWETPDDIVPLRDPFVLEDLNGDDTPELLIAFDNDQHGSNYAIAVYSKSKGTLCLQEELYSQGQPDLRAGYLVTYSGSGRKAWWVQDQYYQWREDHFEWKASWREDCSPPKYEVEGCAFIVTRPAAKAGPPIEYTLEKGGDEENAPSFVVMRKDQKTGAICFRKRLPKSADQNEAGTRCIGAEQLWLFESFTGLPWQAAGKSATNQDKASEAKKFQKFLSVEVTGDDELARLLKPAVERLNGKGAKNK